MSDLRGYQSRGFSLVTAEARRGSRHILVVGPTGMGKTVLIGEFTRRTGGGVLVLVHSEELLEQASARLAALGVQHGVIQGDRPQTAAAVQVASVPTLFRRLGALPPAALVICDEAHRSVAASWQAVLGRYPGAFVLGFTASPYRLGGATLAPYWQAIVSVTSPRELIEEGWLVPPLVYAPDQPDLTGVPTVNGDFHQKRSAAVMTKLTGNVVATWLKHPKATTVVFASSIAHSLELRDAFRAAGVSCEHIHAGTPRAERRATLAALADGSLTVVTQVGLLTEGWDLPRCGTVVIARATQSRGLHRQMIGRGLRPWCPEGCKRAGCGHPGAKARVTVLDHAGNHWRHGMVTEDEVYSLELPEKRQAGVAAVSIRTCLGCFHVYSAKEERCPQCGAVPPVVERKVRVAEGELSELSPSKLYARNADEERLLKTLGKFVRIGKERGYKDSWAKYAWRGMTGRMPTPMDMELAMRGGGAA